MIIWSIHPQYLDVKGLVALWREALIIPETILTHPLFEIIDGETPCQTDLLKNKDHTFFRKLQIPKYSINAR